MVASSDHVSTVVGVATSHKRRSDCGLLKRKKPYRQISSVYTDVIQACVLCPGSRSSKRTDKRGAGYGRGYWSYTFLCQASSADRIAMRNQIHRGTLDKGLWGRTRCACTHRQVQILRERQRERALATRQCTEERRSPPQWAAS